MDCPSVLALLSAEIDGELSADESAAVRRHAFSCERCARARRLLEATRAAFRTLEPEPVSAGFDAAMTRRLGARPHRGGFWLAVMAGVAATLALVAGQPGERAPSGAPRSAYEGAPGWDAGRGMALGPCGDALCAPPNVGRAPRLSAPRLMFVTAR